MDKLNTNAEMEDMVSDYNVVSTDECSAVIFDTRVKRYRDNVLSFVLHPSLR